MLKIRLQRVGRKHEPVFRVVLTESQNGPKSGKFLEILGSYDARDRNETTLKEERIKYWLGQGAQASDTIHNLLINKGIIEGKKINVLPKKSPIKKEGEEVKEEASSTDEAPAEEVKEEAPTETEEKKEEVVEEKKEEEVKEETKEETPVEESKEEVKEEEVKEEKPTEE